MFDASRGKVASRDKLRCEGLSLVPLGLGLGRWAPYPPALRSVRISHTTRTHTSVRLGKTFQHIDTSDKPNITNQYLYIYMYRVKSIFYLTTFQHNDKSDKSNTTYQYKRYIGFPLNRD